MEEQYLTGRSPHWRRSPAANIHSKYEDDLLEMSAHVARDGGRRRGMMAVVCFDAVGERQERALNAGSPWSWPHAASLVKDAIMYRGKNRRSATSDWQRFGFGLGRQAPGLILTHSMLFAQVHGPRALTPVVDDWSRIVRCQLLDFPRGRVTSVPSYEQIIVLKTAPDSGWLANWGYGQPEWTGSSVWARSTATIAGGLIRSTKTTPTGGRR